jgi:ubiquitin C-terminal hydrolase
MPTNKPMIVNPARTKSVIEPDGTQLTLVECFKCETKFYRKEGEKETRCERCRKRKARK